VSEPDPFLTFRCPEGLEAILPPPEPAVRALPDWLRSMPAEAYSPVLCGDDDTVKRCPPFVDAMGCGFVIGLICDLRVENGQFTWDEELPADAGGDFPRSPITFHEPSQVQGTPLFDADRFLVKFHNLWTIEAPPGWSLLFTHPVNRFDLPFTTLTGLVDCDRFQGLPIHFPAHWRDEAFQGVLAKGTPVAQCIPIRRERWGLRTAPMTAEDAQRAHELMQDIRRDKGVYRKRFRA
jgi:hypothetical protein